MGEVYSAEDRKLGRTVALKTLPAATRDDERARRRLLQEARTASALNHTNIVSIYAIEQAGGVDFLVMEYVDGESLTQRIARGPLEWETMVDFGVQVACGVAAAHDCGMIHRDLKPSNILISKRGDVKVVDFGLAKSIELSPEVDATTHTSLTRTGMIVGTLAYMSPEQTRGELLDARSDVFSLGAVLYEAAVGKPPFSGQSQLLLLHAIATCDPPPPSTLKPELPPEFDVIVARALAKEKARRYASAGELEQALRSLPDLKMPAATIAQRPPRQRVFVGREQELERLRQLMHLAAGGSGSLVVITGEPGIGKTSLAGQFLDVAQSAYSPCFVARGACAEQYGSSEPYLPFLEAFGGLASASGNERVLALMRVHAPTWYLQLPASLLKSGEVASAQQDTIGATKERMLREMTDLLDALTKAAPMVLLLEDLHWADPSSADLFRYLGQRIGQQRLLVIGTYRPEDVEITKHPLRNFVRELKTQRICHEMALDALGRDTIGLYLNARFAPNDFPFELENLFVRTTEGHPLFAAGLAELLEQHSEVAQQGGRWRLVRPVSELTLEVPQSVDSMVQKKLDILSDEDRRALEYASIEGEDFTSTTLAALLEADELTVEDRLNGLEKVHRLVRALGSEDLPDGSLSTRYRFVHALYQNTLYEHLSPKRRLTLHRAAGEELLKRFAGQTSKIAAQLAVHFERGRDFVRAVEYWTRVADNAREVYDNDVAVQHYTHALELVERLPQDEQGAVRLGLYHKRGSAHFALSRLVPLEQDFKSMLHQARALSDREAECVALNAISKGLLFSHRIEQLRSLATEAMGLAERTRNPRQRAEAMVNLALSSQVTGELRVATELLDAAVPLARSVNHSAALIPALAYRGIQHSFCSEYSEAESKEAEAVRLSSEARDGFHLALTLFYLGITQVNRGRLSEALATLHRGWDAAQRNNNRMLLARMPNALGWVYREINDLPRAVEFNRRSVEFARESKTAEAQANALINLVYAYIDANEIGQAGVALRESAPLFDDDPWHRWRFFDIRHEAATAEWHLARRSLDEAFEHASRLRTNAAEHGARKYLVEAQRLLGQTLLASGEHDRAVAECLAGIDALRGDPIPLVAWRMWACLGEVLAAVGDHKGAQEAMVEGAAILRTIAASLTDLGVRAAFLEAPAVRAVVGRIGSARESPLEREPVWDPEKRS